MRRLPLIVLIVAAVGVILGGYWLKPDPPVDLREAEAALARKDYVEALAVCERKLAQAPDSSRALVIAGEAATRLQLFRAALDYYSRVPDASPDAATARWAAGEVLAHVGRASQAEAALRDALQLDPTLEPARERLALLLATLGRRWESRPQFLQLIRADQITLERLLLLGNNAKVLDRRSELERYLAAQPDDLLPNLGLARLDLQQGDPVSARKLLVGLLEQRPEFVEAHVQLGEALLLIAPEELPQWRERLPADAEAHPGAWFVQGRWAAAMQQPQAAARCHWEAARRDPNHVAAHFQLAQSLERLGRGEEAAPIAARAELLQKFAATLESIYESPQHLRPQREAAELAAQLGRYWEAQGWYALLLTSAPQDQDARSRAMQIHSQLSPAMPQTDIRSNVAARLDLSNLPLPAPKSSQPAVPAVESAKSQIQFRERAAELGIDFQYFPSRDPPTYAHRMHEITGGGVGVLDMNHDGWPDLYLAQGSQWPLPNPDRERLDRLYLNRGGRFVDVTEAAGIREPFYSQGVAIGDVNDDGFDDIYVANIGANRLYRNNGDGTFADEGLLAGDGASWTTSCAIVDLNGDGHPEIYDVNYVEGEGVYEQLCPTGDKLRACSPLAFSPAADRLLVNDGQGGFRDVSESAGVAAQSGNGLGIVAARLGADPRISLFIANDQQPNFLLRNEEAESAPGFRLRDMAVVAGAAVDREGRAQACMGVAADDADGDGRIDLFVTNFYREANTLYLQESDGFFTDSSATRGLAAPSMETLGFGAQFLDVQLDGWPDLAVVNGHIDDMTHTGAPYRMRPQLFINQSGAKFVEAPAEELSGFFREERLGRAMAVLDFNRDGLEDFAVSHLDTPAAVLENQSADCGHFLAIRLIGVASSRDAIGAVATVEAGGRTRTRQLTAGSGYLASNEKRLIFGLGEATAIDRIAIDWPSGRRQELPPLAIDAEWIVVEGRDAAYRSPLSLESR
ncbi:MAG: VCBS repeat-containing protein [Planctomycetes bacterium]|nr:VCBS repeat-containing protein [Planctomycetota bacterium]